METHDFSNAKVGDKVSNPFYGCGVISKIDKSKWPINVQFNSQEVSFTVNGKEAEEDLISTLYHGHNTFQIIATPVSPYKDGEWIAVLHCDQWKLGKCVGMNQDGWATVRLDGDDETIPPCNYKYHKSLTELNAELNNK